MSEPRPLRKSLLLASGAWTAHVLATAVVCLVMMVDVPRFLAVFEGNDVDIPAATIFVISLSDYFVNFYYTLLVPLALDAMLLVGLNLAPAKFSWLARVWSVLGLLFAVFFLGYSFLAASLAFGPMGPDRLGP